MDTIYQSDRDTVHAFPRGAWVESYNEVDEVAEAYLKAPERSAERAELLRKYRELTAGSPMWVKTPIRGGTV
jgi:hypothetical protein